MHNGYNYRFPILNIVAHTKLQLPQYLLQHFPEYWLYKSQPFSDIGYDFAGNTTLKSICLIRIQTSI